MSLEQLKVFLNTVKGGYKLQENYKQQCHIYVVGIAIEHGLEITAYKFGQLSEEELEGVAGGIENTIQLPPQGPLLPEV